MAPFTHVILTRFNVRLQFLPEGGCATAPDDAWLEDRFRLFETYTLPSMQGQTSTNFQWLVFFDAATPVRFKDRITRYAEWPLFRPWFCETIPLREAVAACLQPRRTHLITTRLDNDDAVSRHFIADVQSQFAFQSPAFVNFMAGLALVEGPKGSRLYAFDAPSNPFISMIERATGFRTVSCDEHMKLSRYGPISNVHGEPRWLQVLHGRNVSNRLTSGMRRVTSQRLEAFSISRPHVADGVLALWADNFSREARARLGRLRRRLAARN
jgi:hypothetical protein